EHDDRLRKVELLDNGQMGSLGAVVIGAIRVLETPANVERLRTGGAKREPDCDDERDAICHFTSMSPFAGLAAASSWPGNRSRSHSSVARAMLARHGARENVWLMHGEST